MRRWGFKQAIGTMQELTAPCSMVVGSSCASSSSWRHGVFTQSAVKRVWREAAQWFPTLACISAMLEPLPVHLWLDPRLRGAYAALLAGAQTQWVERIVTEFEGRWQSQRYLQLARCSPVRELRSLKLNEEIQQHPDRAPSAKCQGSR